MNLPAKTLPGTTIRTLYIPTPSCGVLSPDFINDPARMVAATIGLDDAVQLYARFTPPDVPHLAVEIRVVGVESRYVGQREADKARGEVEMAA